MCLLTKGDVDNWENMDIEHRFDVNFNIDRKE